MGVKFLGGMHMSNNQLTESHEVKYVPKLRFTEFKNDDGWKLKKLSMFGKTVSGLTYSPNDIRNEGLLVLRSSNVQDGKISLEDCVFVDPNIKGANLTEENDILICVRNGSTSLIGKNALIPKDMPLCTHGAFMTVFRSKNYQFVFQLLQTNLYKTQVANDLGARINSINTGNLLNYDFFVPSPFEQQKVASCLSSLDELIQNESSKLEIYKQHKNGLLQRLFPRDGESVPTVRFEGFNGDWVESSSEKTFSRIKTKNLVGEKNVLTISAQKGLISQEEYFNKSVSSKNVSGYYLIKKGEFAYNKSYSAGYPMGAIKKLSRYKQGVVSPLYICFSVDDRIIDSEFFQYYCDGGFLNSELGKIAQEGARNHGLLNIGLDDFFKNIIFKIPKKNEQEKIASCLTSLDEVISNQNNYIEFLKEYKKGLMQQLFPVLEDVSA